MKPIRNFEHEYQNLTYQDLLNWGPTDWIRNGRGSWQIAFMDGYEGKESRYISGSILEVCFLAGKDCRSQEILKGDTHHD